MSDERKRDREKDGEIEGANKNKWIEKDPKPYRHLVVILEKNYLDFKLKSRIEG